MIQPEIAWDDELDDLVRTCPVCGEAWPVDPEFYAKPLGRGMCRACRFERQTSPTRLQQMREASRRWRAGNPDYRPNRTAS